MTSIERDMNEVIEVTCAIFGDADPKMVKNKKFRKFAHISRVRIFTMWALRELFHYRYDEVNKVMGGSSHRAVDKVYGYTGDNVKHIFKKENEAVRLLTKIFT